MRTSLALALALALGMSALSGCSLLIDADPGRLGPRADGGSNGRDAGVDADTDAGSDAGPMCTTDCNDGVACTDDVCELGACRSTPNDARCGSGEICHGTRGCVLATECTTNADCDNGLYCDGDERCAPGTSGADARGCVDGTPPACGDMLDCTSDLCDEATDGCVFTPNDTFCADDIACSVERCVTDGSGDSRGCVSLPDDTRCGSFCMPSACMVGVGCGPATVRDCEDGSPCTTNGCDDSLAMCVASPTDKDGDTFAAAVVDETVCGGPDCDDLDVMTFPGAPELCDARDNDCDEDIDEECTGGDSCADALAFPLESEPGGRFTGTLTVSNESASDDLKFACGHSGGRDLVYYVDVGAMSDVTIEADGGSVDVVLGVADTCESLNATSPCHDDVVPNDARDARIFLHRFGPSASGLSRRVYFAVDGYDASASGEIDVSVTVEPVHVDTCAPGMFRFDITEGGLVVGEIPVGPFVPAEHGTCMTPMRRPLREAILTFVPGADVTVQFEAASPTFTPDLYVRQGTCTGMQVDCVTGSPSAGGGFGARLDTPVEGGVRHFVFVDGAPSGGERYTLRFQPYVD